MSLILLLGEEAEEDGSLLLRNKLPELQQRKPHPCMSSQLGRTAGRDGLGYLLVVSEPEVKVSGLGTFFEGPLPRSLRL